MADPIAPITDDYIDSVIVSNGPFDPNLNKTQGIPTRQLFKDLRDYLLQEIGDVPAIMTDILYADLVTAVTNGTLIRGGLYRITDYQTVHNIYNAVSLTVHTGPTEPLIVTATDTNKIAANALSETYPDDSIIYTLDNSKIPGATKGCILERFDTIQNVRVCNDFRNVVYRRWKMLPAAFNAANAIAQYTTVQGPDGAIYYLSKPGGFAAGTATTPSISDDNWVQVFPDNNYYYSRIGTGNITIFITSNQNPSYTNPVIPVDGSTFIDTPIFPNYGTGFYNIDINNLPGGMLNLVFFNDNQATIVRNLTICPDETGSATIVPYSTTVVLKGAGSMEGVHIDEGMEYSQITATGVIRNWKTTYNMYVATLNVTGMAECTFTPFYGVTRGYLAEVKGFRLEYTVTPMDFQNIYFPSSMGNLKFNTTANAKGWNVLNGLGAAKISTGVVQSSVPDVVVDMAMSWRTFIGYPDFTSSAAHGSSADLQAQITMAKGRHIVYAYEQPSFKSVFDITEGSPLVVSWQTDLAPVNLSTPSGADNSEKRLMTYFTRHGNDFQVQQKDLIGGAWVQQYPPNYAINSVDADNNVVQVTFTPTPAATESRFIII